MNKLKLFITDFSSRVNAPYATRFFTLLIYVWFLIQAVSVWQYRDLFWGESSVIFRTPRTNSLLYNFFFQLVYSPERFSLIYWTHILMAVVSVFEFRWSFITRSITWASGMILFSAAPQCYNSGVLFMLLMAVYSIFVYTKASSSIPVVITNLCRVAMVLQVILIYFYSSLYKLGGGQWLSGEAVYYALNIDVYSSPFWQSMSKYTLLWMVVTYLALAYQLLFPLLLLFKKQRSWLLIIGIMFHVMIGIVMNLWDFAFAMIFCYALFMKEEHAKFLMPFRTLRK